MARVAQASFTTGELAPELHARVDLAQYLAGLKLCNNFIVKRTGGVSNRPGTRCVVGTRNDERARLIPFEFSADDSYCLVFTHLKMQIIRNGGVVLVPSTTTVATIDTPYALADLPRLRFIQSADVLTITHPDHEPAELKRQDHHLWTFEEIGFIPTLAAPTDAQVTLTKVGSGSGTTWKYRVTFETEGGEESLPGPVESLAHGASLDADTRIDFAITLPAGAVRANVYKYKGGSYGWIGSTEDGSFSDTGLAAELDTTPPTDRNPFADGNNPTCCGYWQQRLFMAGSNAKPDTVWASKTSSFHNFTTSEPLQDSDSITFALASRQVNQIQHLIDLKAMLLFTTAAVWSLKRADQKGLTPKLEGGVDIEFGIGSGDLAPCVSQDAAVFVERSGRRVHAVGYDGAADGWRPEELTLLSSHLLRESPAVDWAYAEVPHSVMWIVRADGVLLSLTYVRDQKVIGWGRHDTPLGRYEAVTVVKEGDEDVPYFVVRRLIGGEWKRFVERMATRVIVDVKDGFFVDCGVTYDEPFPVSGVERLTTGVWLVAPDLGDTDGAYFDVAGLTGAEELNDRRWHVIEQHVDADDPDLWHYRLADRFSDEPLLASQVSSYVEGGQVRRAVRTLSGLDHLEGEQVIALADGNVEGPFTIAGGAITLGYPASRAHVGLAYQSDLQTLSIPADAEAWGRQKRPVQVQLWVNQSRGFWFGPDANSLDEHKQRTDEPMGSPTRPTSGMLRQTIAARWTNGGQVYVRQSDPLPVEVLAVAPVFDLGGG